MKKIFLLSILLFQLTFVFGQYGANKDCAESGCGDKSQNITRCWGVVRTFDQGIQIRVKGPIENCYNAINGEPNRHSFMWHIEISGLKRVKQDCKLYVTGGDNRKSDYMIGSNTEGNVLTDKMTVDFFTFSNAETIGLEILPFGNTSTSKNTNQTNNSNNNQNTQPTTTINNSQNQTNNSPQQNQANQVIKTLPNNTNTEILNVLETTTNQVTNTLTNSIEKSKGVVANNEIAIKAAQEEFEENNLSDKEIDSLLANPSPDNYATINIYKEIKCCHWYTVINGKNLPVIDRNNKKIEYRVYSGNKLLIQTYPVGGIGTSLPIKSVNIRIRKGKTYHFIIKKVGMADFTIEQVDEEPVDKKGNKVYENTNQKIKSDIE